VHIEPIYTVKVSEILSRLKALDSGKNPIDDLDRELNETLNSYSKSERILILGASGMAGHVIYKYLKDTTQHHIETISFRKRVDENTVLLDVRKFDQLEAEIERLKPDFIINAIGILVKGSNENPANSILLNSYFPHFLSTISKKYDFRIVHLSTDCVFSGNDGGYLEDSFKDANDVYGRSKSLGEIDENNHITIRTSIIGPEFKEVGTGLLHWFLKQSGDVTGFSNAFWSGISTLQLAKVVSCVINDMSVVGICHVTNNEKISKYELLTLFNDIWSRSITINNVVGKCVDKSFKDTLHKVAVRIPSYENMLGELREFMIVNDTYFNYSKNYNL
jgi:dTDP-4-dehydrorhamnose reductase